MWHACRRRRAHCVRRAADRGLRKGASSAFKRFRVRPTEARVPNHNHGWRGHGCTWLAVLKHGGILGACFKTLLQLRRPCLQHREWFGTDQQGARPGAHIQSVSRNAASVGSQRPATIMATAAALPRPLMATISPGKTWLPLNVTIDANDRGDSPSSYRARALGTGDQEMSRGTA